jgi:hypothetical protein
MDTLTLVPGNSLITATPEEGRQLAVNTYWAAQH